MQNKFNFSPENKDQLQASVIWAYTKQGALQRARIYKSRRSNKRWDKDKENFRTAIRDYLYLHFFKRRSRHLTEKELIKEIFLFRQYLLRNHRSVIDAVSFSFGNAQKFVNLYLKGLWLIEKTSCPPHFPVDRIVQQRGLKGEVIAWTGMNRIAYKKIIKKVQDAESINQQELAVWEALNYLEWSKKGDKE